MTLTDDSRVILAEIEADARATYNPAYDGVDEATAMEWEAEAQREYNDAIDAMYFETEATDRLERVAREREYSQELDPLPF